MASSVLPRTTGNLIHLVAILLPKPWDITFDGWLIAQSPILA